MGKRNGGQCLRTQVLWTFFHYSQLGREQMAGTSKNRWARGGNGMDSFVFWRWLINGRGFCHWRKFFEDGKDVRFMSGNWGDRKRNIGRGNWCGKKGDGKGNGGKKGSMIFCIYFDWISMKKIKANDGLWDICLKKKMFESIFSELKGFFNECPRRISFSTSITQLRAWGR